MSALARRQLAGEGAVLAFHGLREDGASVGVQDAGLHLTVSTFRAVCQHLSANYHVMPLAEIAALLRAGEPLPPGAVGLSFDDGYASNYELAFPVLKEAGLPATVFLATGFVDRVQPLWFQDVDLAMLHGAIMPGRLSLADALASLKTLPDEAMRALVSEMKRHVPEPFDEPQVTRPMTWSQVREMRDSGLVEFGGHTHTHPVLSRCGVEHQKREIETCAERIRAELGAAPRLFAFPNGGAGDYSPDTLELLRLAGFESAWTMVSGRVSKTAGLYELPRYGSPESVWETEATVSGAFELMRQWRGGGK